MGAVIPSAYAESDEGVYEGEDPIPTVNPWIQFVLDQTPEDRLDLIKAVMLYLFS